MKPPIDQLFSRLIAILILLSGAITVYRWLHGDFFNIPTALIASSTAAISFYQTQRRGISLSSMFQGLFGLFLSLGIFSLGLSNDLYHWNNAVFFFGLAIIIGLLGKIVHEYLYTRLDEQSGKE